jgi:hypothetical protein
LKRIHLGSRLRCNRTDSAHLAADSLKEVEEAGLTSPDSILNYVAKHTPPGMPPHSLTIKTNSIFRLLRNFSLHLGLVKNVRVVVIDVGVRIVTSSFAAWDVWRLWNIC